MGLDMEIRRITKPHMDDSVIYDRVDISGIILTAEELEAPKYCQLAPYTQQLQVRCKYYNMAKILEDYKMPAGSYLSMRSSLGIAVTAPKTGKTVEISNDDIERKYTIERVERCFVCDCAEVRYWRKAYDIQDWFHENIEVVVENTGFYILSGELLLRFNKAFQNDKVKVEEPGEESALFYWEWY